MTKFRRIALATLAAPLALALSACGSGEEEATGAVTGEPVARVAAPAGQSWTTQAVRTEQGGWLVGNPEAPIKLVEYGSLTCPACAAFAVDGATTLDEQYIDSGRVNYEFRSVLIHGVVDLLLTRMLECAPTEVAVPLANQIWFNLDAVTGPFQQNAAALEQAMALPQDQRFAAIAEAGGMLDWFAARGISRDQGEQCLADTAAVEQLAEKAQAQATQDQVTGTPTFFLNGRKIDATRWSAVEPLLQQAGARD